MNIDTVTLDAQYERASRDWSFIGVTEAAFDLPPMLLFAVGSRETNLTNEVGDGGHGHGVWQLDNRSHTIPSGFDSDVTEQCHTAATMLRALLDHFGNDVRRALAAYNAGAGTVEYNVIHGLDVDHGTAGGDYSADTYARMVWLAHNEHVINPIEGNDMTKEQEAKLDETLRLLRLVINGDAPGTAPADQHPYAESMRTLKSDLADLRTQVAAIRAHVGA